MAIFVLKFSIKIWVFRIDIGVQIAAPVEKFWFMDWFERLVII